MRTWRIYEKPRKGDEDPDTFDVDADHLDVSPVGLTFVCFIPEGQNVVAVIPYGQFARCALLGDDLEPTHVHMP